MGRPNSFWCVYYPYTGEGHAMPSGGSELLEGLVQAGAGGRVVLFSFSKFSCKDRVLPESEKPSSGGNSFWKTVLLCLCLLKR